MKKNVKNFDFMKKEEGFPIKKSLQFIKLYEIFSLSIIIFVASFFFGIFWHIYVKDIEDW